MAEYESGETPEVIVVGDQRLADAIVQSGIQARVYPAAPTVTALWDGREAGVYPVVVDVVIFTDGTGSGPDDLESSLAAYAPYADVFLVASAQRGQEATSRAQVLATTMEDGDPTKPIWVLPIEDLGLSISTMQQILMNKIAWAAPAAPAVAPAPSVAPPVQPQYAAPVAEQPQYVAPPVAPAAPVQPQYVAPAVEQPQYVAPPVAPVEPQYTAPAVVQTFSAETIREAQMAPQAPAQAPGMPIPGQAVGYEQAAIYSSDIAAIISQGSAKRPDAIPGQMTIACMSSKGGSGKSTTAISLAGMIARSSAAAGAPKKVVIVDLDIRDGQVGSLINQYLPTAVSIRVMPKWDAATVTANLVHDKRLGIDALLAPIRPRNADDVGPDFYRQIIQVLQTTHDVVILDCSVNYLDPLLGVAFTLADEILFVTTLATTSVQGMARALTELFADPAEGGLGIPREKVGIVANQVIHNVGMGKDKLLRAALGAPLVGQIPAEHDEVLIQTNSNRMDNLLKHHRLGPAYYKLAKTCLPGWNLAALTVEASQTAAPAQPVVETKKRGFFGSR